jgi:ATP-dependent helicase Lhr and Lhr-like helicase
MSDRQKQKRQMPEVLIITPESLHLLLGQKGYKDVFKTLRIIAVDEWHELIGSKRGVQVELAISRIVGVGSPESGVRSRESEVGGRESGVGSRESEVRSQKSGVRSPESGVSLWGISATIGNLQQAMEVLLSPLQLVGQKASEGVIVRAKLQKQIEVESIIPDEIEKYPWAGHLGIKLAEKVLPILEQSKTTLIFINTRGMSEMWYQTLLRIAPELAGAIALHHGSIEMELRTWVEEALHDAKLKAVVCTASLDLGVDFRPVETVIQVGSPKGVARFLQRAGRSGHSPDAVSKIYFLPTHSLELIEAAALKSAIEQQFIESREPMMLCYDVLVQYLGTLAISDGFIPPEIWKELKATNCYAELTEDEWNDVLYFITSGGNALQQYDEYKKVEVEDGVYKIKSRRIAMRHRLHIGTIVSDPMLKVKYLGGGYIGIIEEGFISRLEPGDSFTLAGKQLELIMIKDMNVIVRNSKVKKSIVPSWMGGRLPLSASLGKVLRSKFDQASLIGERRKMEGQRAAAGEQDLPIELTVLKPLFDLQAKLSHVPKENELLIEQIETKDGFHLFVYPFEGRLVHEAMAAVLAYRISRITPITFSIAMNDYGFELLSDQPIPVDDSNVYELFSLNQLMEDIQRSVNATEMAKRKFRDIAVIGGLIFQGYPGEHKKTRHLQASAGLLFNVFNEYDPDNVLVRQAFQEVFDQQMEEVRLREMLQRIQHSRIVLTYPQRLTPFCFPIKVDSMRENLTSEKLEDRIKKMQQQLESLL